MAVNSKLSFINRQIEKNKLSHAFLLETNNLQDCYRDIKQLIQELNCNLKFESNCKKCNLCKLIEMNNLPSFITISPDGMSIKRQQLEDMYDKFSKKPVFSKYNVYVILNAEKMTESASNTILKFLEEPEDNIIGFIITTNKKGILPTISSRCEYAFINYDISSTNDEFYDLAQNYLNDINNTDDLLVNRNKILLKYNTREVIESLFENIFSILKKDYETSFTSSINNKDINIYSKKIHIAEKSLQLIKYNVNLELILDYFVIEMRKIND